MAKSLTKAKTTKPLAAAKAAAAATTAIAMTQAQNDAFRRSIMFFNDAENPTTLGCLCRPAGHTEKMGGRIW